VNQTSAVPLFARQTVWVLANKLAEDEIQSVPFARLALRPPRRDDCAWSQPDASDGLGNGRCAANRVARAWTAATHQPPPSVSARYHLANLAVLPAASSFA
jgi:hypothetical protein